MTVDFLNGLKKRKQALLESWGNGNFTRESVEGTVQLNAQSIGQVNELNEFIDAVEELQQLDLGPQDIERV